MPLSESDKFTTENCFKEEGWCGRRVVKEFPGKGERREVGRTEVANSLEVSKSSAQLQRRFFKEKHSCGIFNTIS